jgi:hypothetical protein
MLHPPAWIQGKIEAPKGEKIWEHGQLLYIQKNNNKDLVLMNLVILNNKLKFIIRELIDNTLMISNMLIFRNTLNTFYYYYLI